MYLVQLFPMVGFFLLAFKGGSFDLQAAVLSLAVPLVMGRFVRFTEKRWPIDRALLILVLFLVCVGLVTIKGVSVGNETPRTQAVYALVGLFTVPVGIIVMRKIRSWEKWAMWLAPLAILALLAPWPLGRWHDGARNWVYIGSFSGQPSEFVKPLLVVILAAGLSNHPSFAKSAAWVGCAAALCAILLWERDLGALLLYFITTMLMYYAATHNVPVTLAGFACAAGGAVAAYKYLPYLRTRIAVWRNPWVSPYGSGFQIIQSLTAIASGSWFGAGLGLGSPDSTPLIDSDLVFAAVTEEFGLVFSLGMIAIYGIILIRGLIIAQNSRNSFHALTALGLSVFFGSQTALIIAGSTRLLPLTGITLPLVARGGSSLVATMFSMGLLLGISSVNAEEEAADLHRIEVMGGEIRSQG